MKVHHIIRNSLISFLILGLTAALCLFLQQISEADTHVPLLFVLAVVLVSRFTEGYAYGILASIVSVIGVNYVFTYPYFEIDFSLTGYSLTFFVMLAVAWCVSALTTQIKEQEKIKREVETEKMRSNLLRAVSHDIRTPLTAISGAASVLLDNHEQLSDADVRELALNMKEESQWLIRIVENLLSITRMEGGSGAANIKTEEELAEEIVSSAIMKFKKRYPNMDVAAYLPDDLVLVPMDGILIEQVLVNLLENAVQHGRTTSKISIHVETEADKAIFCVEDNGIGIKDSVLPRIFNGELHSKGDESSDAKRNMGIGLSVCMSIVKAHKGDMKAENMDKGGARFTFWLPMGTQEDTWKSETEY